MMGLSIARTLSLSESSRLSNNCDNGIRERIAKDFFGPGSEDSRGSLYY